MNEKTDKNADADPAIEPDDDIIVILERNVRLHSACFSRPPVCLRLQAAGE